VFPVLIQPVVLVANARFFFLLVFFSASSFPSKIYFTLTFLTGFCGFDPSVSVWSPFPSMLSPLLTLFVFSLEPQRS